MYVGIRFPFYIVVICLAAIFSYIVANRLILNILENVFVSKQNSVILTRPWISIELKSQIFAFIIYQTFNIMFYCLISGIMIYDLFVVGRYNVFIIRGKRYVFIIYLILSLIIITVMFFIDKCIYLSIIKSSFLEVQSCSMSIYLADYIVVIMVMSVFNFLYIIFKKVNVAVYLCFLIYPLFLFFCSFVTVPTLILVIFAFVLINLNVYVVKNEFSGGYYE